MEVWLENGLMPITARAYCRWVELFIEDCERRGRDPDEELTRQAVEQLVARYVRARGILERGANNMLCALHAWSRGLRACGVKLRQWANVVAPTFRPLLEEFREHFVRHRGVAPITARRTLERVEAFLRFQGARRRPAARPRLADVDAYVLKLRSDGFSGRTIKQVCSAVRAYLRFLHVTHRLPRDLAASVIAPRHRPQERPPRALPWTDVRAIIRSVDRRTPTGCRDYAMLLMMASYGLGGAEVRNIHLDDVDWEARLLRVRRPKTGQTILLPLLPAVARALTAYLQCGRPARSLSRALFVQVKAPRASGDEGLSSSAVGHVVTRYARAAGVRAGVIGSHSLRHSHATRQVELGAPMKVIGDILGHRSPTTTSAYVRVALRQLRQVALPVPS